MAVTVEGRADDPRLCIQGWIAKISGLRFTAISLAAPETAVVDRFCPIRRRCTSPPGSRSSKVYDHRDGTRGPRVKSVDGVGGNSTCSIAVHAPADDLARVRLDREAAASVYSKPRSRVPRTLVRLCDRQRTSGRCSCGTSRRRYSLPFL